MRGAENQGRACAGSKAFKAKGGDQLSELMLGGQGEVCLRTDPGRTTGGHP